MDSGHLSLQTTEQQDPGYLLLMVFVFVGGLGYPFGLYKSGSVR